MSGVDVGRWKKKEQKCYKFSAIVYLCIFKDNINYTMKLWLENELFVILDNSWSVYWV